MVWDATVPAGTDLISAGDDVIRELKEDIAEALGHEFSTFPGADTSTPIFIPGFMKGNTASRPTGDSLVEGRLYLNETLNVIERYTGSVWESVSTNFPTGTKIPFYQASVPTGWTAVAINDKFLRVVTAGGTGGSTGGTTPASTSLSHHHTVVAHDHTFPDHQHVMKSDSVANASLSAVQPYIAVTSGAGGKQLGTYTNGGSTSRDALEDRTFSDGGGATGTASPLTDSQLGVFAYADVVIGSKD